MSGKDRDRIAQLLDARLKELRLRDGVLPSAPRRGKSPNPPAIGGASAKPDLESPRAGRTVESIGGFFDPAARLNAVSARAARTGADSVLSDVPGMIECFRQRYPGRDVAEIIGREFETATVAAGPDFIEVCRPTDMEVTVMSRSRAVTAISSALWLLPGIREKVACELCGNGNATIDSLSSHHRFGSAAARLLRTLDRGGAARVSAIISDRGGAAHPLNLAVTAWFEPRDFLFLDIETGGLFGGSPIVVAGLASACDPARPGLAVVKILCATTPDGEAELVRRTVEEIEGHKVLVSFNGKSFDLPYVSQRAAYYGTVIRNDPFHLDLLGYSRRLFSGKTTDCRLSTLAREILGMARDLDVPGSLVPCFYENYLKEPARNAGLLAAIAIHNCYDMDQTVRLFHEHIKRLEGCGGVVDQEGALAGSEGVE
ncbi:MAG TPA: ribonuclease H-like domain-containing protein [Myxococcota bacterium]|nr:ribonuclease H-like domain-containing protein [Myxococcota bacterium]